MLSSKNYLSLLLSVLAAVLLTGCPSPDSSFAGSIDPADPNAGGGGGGGNPTLVGELELQVSDGGMVTSNPSIVSCTGLFPTQFCFAQAPIGTVVTLTAVPAAGFRFSLWDNCPGPNGDDCVFTMNTAQVIRANFAAL